MALPYKRVSWGHLRAIQPQRQNIHTIPLEDAVNSATLGFQVVYCMTIGPNLFTLNLSAFTNKNTQVLTVSMEMVYMAESQPSNNQSECLDLPQNYLTK